MRLPHHFEGREGGREGGGGGEGERERGGGGERERGGGGVCCFCTPMYFHNEMWVIPLVWSSLSK